MSDILEEIIAHKKTIIESDKKSLNLDEVKKQARNKPKHSSFQENIESKDIAIIAEIKKKSPSQGLIKQNFNVAEIAESYKDGGAACISVLTDKKYFAGNDSFIEIAKEASELPVLRKDFIIDPYQIYQAKAIGADAILLIMSAITKNQAQEFEQIAYDLGLDVLVESHNKKELEQALNLQTKLIGINNRNLKTLDTSLDTIKELKNIIPENKIIISESGINSKEDFEQVKSLGIKAFLIGGYLMKQDNITASLSDLIN